MNENTGLAGRTAVVTGAGSGLGRAEALALARAGANVVVNDIGPAAHDVATEIAALGVGGVAVTGDIGDWSLGQVLVQTAVERFGSLDVVVNNAGITRDAMLFNLREQDWDDVVRIHLKGHASLSRAAAAHWRDLSKSTGDTVYGRVVNTSSEAFLFGPAGQANYGAAKGGITTLTLSTAHGLARYGVRANAICPRARTGMTADIFGDSAQDGGTLDILAPERVATLVAYLASPAADQINGQVFVVYGKMVALMAAPTVERRFDTAGDAFTVAELDEQLGAHFHDRDPHRDFAAYSVAALDDTGTENVAKGGK